MLLLLALVALPYLDAAGLDAAAETVARTCFTAAPIVMSAGFFLSVAPPTATRPNRFIYLTYLGGLALVVGTAILGFGLLA
ncbi:hypothetical protein BH24ACT26_BH24ACT26_06870 [soil metagenome]